MGINREQIIAKWRAITPRDRDRWVAEVVFGHKVVSYADDDDYYIEINGDGDLTDYVMLPYYSRDISAAWAVFECHPYIEIARLPGAFTVYGVRINGTDGVVRAMTQKPTFPEAICIAAIIAKEVAD